MKGTVSLNNLYNEYSEKIQFIKIYIREAHPIDGWWFGKGLPKFLMKFYSPKVSMDVYDPKTIGERRKVAGDCQEALKYGITTYVDDMDDSVSKAYAAHPTRLFLIGTDGKVKYDGGLGPWGFKPGQLRDAIEKYLKIN